MTDTRSERLRERRKQSRRLDRGPDQPDPEGVDETTSEPSEPDETDGAAPAAAEPSVKDERVGTYMYLPESQKKDLSRLYNVLKAEYEYEYDRELEKNRHFYPLVVRYGLDGLDGLDASELHERLDRELPETP